MKAKAKKGTIITERTSHERMSCPFYVSYDFAEVSRIIDVGSAGRITGAEKMGTVWLIPKDAEKP